MAIRLSEPSPPIQGAVDWAPMSAGLLRRALVATDMTAVAAAWLVVLGPIGASPGNATGRLAALAVLVAGSIALLAGYQLYLARICRVRVVEVSRLARVSIIAAVTAHAAERPLNLDLSVQRSIAAGGLMWFALCLSRGAYTSWLRRQRALGHFTRPVVIVGERDEAQALSRLLEDNPADGLRLAAIVDPRSDVLAALERHGSDSVIVAGSTPQLNSLTARLLDAGVHVHLSTGLTGMDHRRLRAQPLARQPLFYIERVTVSPWQLITKRVVDVVGGTIALVVAAPVLAVAALAIKLDGGGPILFRNERIGRGGRPFMVFKLRTMVVNAESQLHLVQAANERRGPLFKSRSDPRVTRVGRILRATSIDELPQLFNVLRGTMSLVGPRPALAHEVEQFDADLQGRTRVKPGMTGLWQIEARDDPSFDAYRRLDLFYLDNWSLELDFVILLSTARAVAVQALREFRRKWKPSGDAEVIDLTLIDLTVNSLTMVPASVELGATGTQPLN